MKLRRINCSGPVFCDTVYMHKASYKLQ